MDPKEKEDLKDLIEECQTREKKIEQARLESTEALKEILWNIAGAIAIQIIKITGQRNIGEA